MAVQFFGISETEDGRIADDGSLNCSMLERHREGVVYAYRAAHARPPEGVLAAVAARGKRNSRDKLFGRVGRCYRRRSRDRRNGPCAANKVSLTSVQIDCGGTGRPDTFPCALEVVKPAEVT